MNISNCKFVTKQYVKMFFQHVLLPAVYTAGRRKPIKEGYVILADAHHDSLPFSMSALRRELYEHPELDVREMFHDNSSHSALENMSFMISFMREYAQAQIIVLCDDFLPAASCRKRRGTKIIQLWHACGAFKKFGKDSDEDIPSFYRGSVTSNWNMVTVSSAACVKPFAGAMGLPVKRVRPVGVSRTDEYYSSEFNMMCRRRFFAGNSRAAGKKIVLWAPTFRGNASEASVEGLPEIRKAMELLGDDYYFIIKLHPHSQKNFDPAYFGTDAGKLNVTTDCSMPTEELLAAADILVTDYSSIIFDAMIYRLPIVLFATDLAKYAGGRGFYLNYDSIPAVKASDPQGLADAIRSPKTADVTVNRMYRAFFNIYMSGCDGHATERVVKQMLSWSGQAQE